MTDENATDQLPADELPAEVETGNYFASCERCPWTITGTRAEVTAAGMAHTCPPADETDPPAPADDPTTPEVPND